MFNFGAGRAYLNPAGSQPVELGVVQSADLDLKVDLKELRGPFRYPVAVADGKGTASGKVSFAELWPEVLTQILSGTLTAGSTPQAAISEKHTVPLSSTYIVTLTNATTIVATTETVIVIVGGDRYYYNRTTGSPASATAANPTGGSYSIASGVLTFASTDSGNVVYVTYLYTPAGTANVSVALQQVGMNQALTFTLYLVGQGKDIYTNGAQQFIVTLNSCLAPSLKFGFKLDDFTMMDLDFQAFIDVNGNLGAFYLVSPNA